jgi:alpha-ketoglutarate-dependent taurine dioxygenase
MESFCVLTTTSRSDTHTYLYLLIRSFPGMKHMQHSLKQYTTLRTQCTSNSKKVCLHCECHLLHVRSTGILYYHALYCNASCLLTITSYVSYWVDGILKNINDKYKLYRAQYSLSIYICFCVAGEILVFDNIRLVHGRKGYDDKADNTRLLVGAYLDWDLAYSRIRVLRQKLRGHTLSPVT